VRFEYNLYDNLVRGIMNLAFLKTPDIETQNKITLWLNHMLVIYAFLIPINNNAKSSLFFTMLLLFLYRRNFIYYLKEAFHNKVVQAFLLFYLVGVIGMFYSQNMEMAQSHMDKAKYLLFPLFFISFMDKRFAFRVIGAFITGMFVAEIFSYLIHFGFLPYEYYIGGYEIYKTKAYSPAPFMSHGAHNVGLSIVIAFLLYQLLNKKNLSLKIKIFSILFIISATINMSFIASRTGYVLYLFILFIVFLLSYKKHFFKAISIATILAVVLGYLGYNYSSTVNQRVNQTIKSIQKIVIEDNYHSSVGLRIGFTRYSLDVIKDNWLFGVGTGDHMDEVRKIIPPKHAYIADSKEIAKPHNVYIQILLQFGIVGFGFMVFLFYRILTYNNISSYNKDLITITSLSTLVFMLPGMFFGTFELPLFATFISALIATRQRDFDVAAYNQKQIFIYAGIVALFLIIGVTR